MRMKTRYERQWWIKIADKEDFMGSGLAPDLGRKVSQFRGNSFIFQSLCNFPGDALNFRPIYFAILLTLANSNSNGKSNSLGLDVIFTRDRRDISLEFPF